MQLAVMAAILVSLTGEVELTGVYTEAIAKATGKYVPRMTRYTSA